MKAVIVLAIVMSVPPLCGQNVESNSKASDQPQTFTGNFLFYYHSCDEGESKLCFTYLGTSYVGEKAAPIVVVCNGSDDLEWKESFLNLLASHAGKGMSKEEMYRQSLTYAQVHSKTFSVSFSENPWRKPLPSSGLMMTRWNCTKDKTITCTRTEGAPVDIRD